MAQGAPNSPNSPSLGAGDEVLGRVKVTDGAEVADVLDQGTSNGLAVVVLDGSGNPVTSFNGGAVTAVGTVADDSPTPGAPVMVGGSAVSPDGTDPGAVAEADVARFRTDLNRRLLVSDVHPENFSYHYDSTSAVVTDGTVHADPGDGFAVFITDIVFSIGVATASSIFIEESTTKILGPYYLEAIAGRGLSIHFETPKRCTASTAILVTTTGATTLSVDITGFVAAV